MSWRNLSLSIVPVLACLAMDGIAEESDPAELQTAISEAAELYVKAFADRDPEALAALFTEEAEYVDENGTVFHGRQAIQAEYKAAFAANPPGTIELEFLSLRPIAPGVLVEDGISTFTPKKDGPISRTRYSATHVKQEDGTWRIASIRELEPAQVTPHDRLRDLAWLVGKWHEDVAGNIISTEWKWSDDGNFLLSEFSIRQDDRKMNGTHRVGWDGERKQFRSWIFDATGGSADGWWRADDGGWSVDINGVDAEGVRISSTLSYIRDGAEALAVSQTERMRAGENLPGSTHRVVRQPPEPSEEKSSEDQPLSPKTKPKTATEPSTSPKPAPSKTKPAAPKKK